jgi:WD40 repeat protein
MAVLKGHADYVCAVAFAPDGKLLATGSYDRTAKLWDVAAGQERRTLHGHAGIVLAVAFSPDGKTLATGGLDNTVHLWDTRTFTPRATLLWNAGHVFSAAFTGDSKSLAAGGGSREGSHLPGEVKIWDVTTGQCHATVPGQTGPVAFSSRSSELLTVAHDMGVKTWPATLTESAEGHAE